MRKCVLILLFFVFATGIRAQINPMLDTLFLPSPNHGSKYDYGYCSPETEVPFAFASKHDGANNGGNYGTFLVYKTATSLVPIDTLVLTNNNIYEFSEPPVSVTAAPPTWSVWLLDISDSVSKALGRVKLSVKAKCGDCSSILASDKPLTLSVSNTNFCTTGQTIELKSTVHAAALGMSYDFLWYKGGVNPANAVKVTINTTTATSLSTAFTDSYTISYGDIGLYTLLVRDHLKPTAVKCQYTASVFITASLAPVYTITGGGEYKEGTSPNPVIFSFDKGKAPYNCTYVDGSQISHTVTVGNSSSVNPVTFTVPEIIDGTYKITALTDADNGNCDAVIDTNKKATILKYVAPIISFGTCQQISLNDFNKYSVSFINDVITIKGTSSSCNDKDSIVVTKVGDSISIVKPVLTCPAIYTTCLKPFEVIFKNCVDSSYKIHTVYSTVEYWDTIVKKQKIVLAPQITYSKKISPLGSVFHGVGDTIIYTVTDSINGGIITWYSDSKLTKKLATGNVYKRILTYKGDNICYATRTINAYVSKSVEVFFLVVCNKMTVIIPPTQIDVPYYKQYITLKNNNPNAYWTIGYSYQPKQYGSVFSMKIDKTDTSYTIFSGSDSDVMCADDIEYKVNITNYLPYIETRKDTSINISVTDTFNVAFEVNELKNNGYWRIVSESNKAAIDTISTVYCDPFIYNSAHVPVSNCSLSKYVIYTLKAQKIGVDTLYWEGINFPVNGLTYKRIIVHIEEQKIPAPQITPNSLVSPFYLSNETADKPVILSVKDSVNGGVITWYSDSLLTKAVGSGNKYTVVPPFKLSNTKFYVTRTIGTNVSEKTNVGIAVFCKVTLNILSPIEVNIPLYKENIVLKTTLSDAIWSLGSNIQKGSIFSYKIDKADTNYSIILGQQDPVLCGYQSTTYHVTITNDLPFVNTNDTTIAMNIGDSIDVLLSRKDSPKINWTIKNKLINEAVDTIETYNYDPLEGVKCKCIHTDYTVYTIKAIKTGIDTLVWEGFDGTTYYSKRIICKVGTQIIQDTCPKIAIEAVNIRICTPEKSVPECWGIQYHCSYLPQGVEAVDTLYTWEQYNALEVGTHTVDFTVVFNNACNVKVSNTVNVTQHQTPKFPTIHEFNYDSNAVKTLYLDSIPNSNCIVSWHRDGVDYGIGNSVLVPFDSIGTYMIYITLTDTVEKCSSIGNTYLNIKDPKLPSLSGTVNAGGNPFSNGTVQLFEQNGADYTAVAADSIHIDGTFTFKWLKTTKYLIRALPSASQTSYLPSYYVNALQWQDATVIDLKGKIIGLDLALVPSDVTSSGAGSISGAVDLQDTSFVSKQKALYLLQMTVIVMKDGNVVSYGLTDFEGNYTINNLSDGIYDVYVEMPGYSKWSQSVSITNGSSSQAFFTLKKGEITSMTDVSANTDEVIYPNPANSNISIRTNKTFNTIQIVNIDGVVVFEKQNPEKLIAIACLSSGFYVIKLISDNQTIIKTFVKQ